MKRQTYYLQRERRGCIITLLVGDVCLHLRWRAHLPGDRYEFEGISITYVNLAILTETDLLRRIADLPLGMTQKKQERKSKGYCCSEEPGCLKGPLTVLESQAFIKQHTQSPKEGVP